MFSNMSVISECPATLFYGPGILWVVLGRRRDNTILVNEMVSQMSRYRYITKNIILLVPVFFTITLQMKDKIYFLF